MTCATCVYFDPAYPVMEDDDPEEVIGSCRWQPVAGLPYAWRWTEREVVGVTASDGLDCPCYTAKEDKP